MNKEISEYIVTGTVLRYDGCYDSESVPTAMKKRIPRTIVRGIF